MKDRHVNVTERKRKRGISHRAFSPSCVNSTEHVRVLSKTCSQNCQNTKARSQGSRLDLLKMLNTDPAEFIALVIIIVETFLHH